MRIARPHMATVTIAVLELVLLTLWVLAILLRKEI